MLVNEKIAIEHGLKSDEYKKICKLLKRTPNITELGIFSAMWNEHCSYKSSLIILEKMTFMMLLLMLKIEFGLLQWGGCMSSIPARTFLMLLIKK